jgi:hypothetical protein
VRSPNGYLTQFTYNTDPIPHVTQIAGPDGGFTLSYLQNQSVYEPFTSTPSGTTTFLQGRWATFRSRTPARAS